MGVRRVCATLVCKATYHVLRLLKHGGTSLPGKLALKIDPTCLAHFSQGVKTIVITGTNGKTTSTHIVAQALENAGKRAFYNRSGANLIQGITTEFALRSTLSGKPTCEYAAIECDEGAMKRVCAALDPDVIVVTNVFRDQLDRYGEVMHTRENILNGLKDAPHATLVLNADDSIVVSLSREVPNEVVYYGVSCEIYPKRVEDLSDATRCIVCGAPYVYSYRTYGHLGGFSCPECGFSRPDPQVAVDAIEDRASMSCTLAMRVNGEPHRVPVDVPASYDVYNCVATVAGLLQFGLSSDEAFAAVGKFKHGFGRSETFQVGGSTVRLMLMKNPAGCNQIINLLLNEPDENMGIACILNDQECDGTDVSWIYDAAFEALAERLDGAFCAGSRAEDMAVRLKYAGFKQENLRITHDYDELLAWIGAEDHAVTVVANYSAMLEFRAAAARKLGLAGFWEG